MTLARSNPATSLVVLTCMLLAMPDVAGAQDAVGTGPLTAALPETEPTVGVLRVGPIRFAPGLIIREIGWDDNVFDEPEEDSPKDDFVAALQPDVSAYARLRFLRVAAYAGAELTYYNQYDSERSVGHMVRARGDILLSRIRPFFGFGTFETRTRPNGEIDTRADRQEDEWSGGVAFDLSDSSLIYGASYLFSTTYENAFEDGVDLSRALTRDGQNYEAGMKTDLTPLLSMQLNASYREDVFEFEPVRNSQSWFGTATFDFAPEAVVTGSVVASYRDMKFSDPGIKPFRGFVGSARLTYTVLEIGRLSGSLSRGVEYSFDALEAYYVEQSVMAAYTHRLFGAVDAQVTGTHASFDYDARPTLPAHTDTLDTVGGSLGYNLQNRTRIALNYEYARRRSPAFSDRNYQRRRTFLSWQVAF
jgi:hypothetical protein